MQHEKICKTHGELIQENILVESNKTAKRGYTLRCRLCKLEKDRRFKANNREIHTAYSVKYKKENSEQYNLWMREDRKKDPQKYKRYEQNYIKKHGRLKIRKMDVARIHGLTLEQYDSMFEKQKHLCKICNKEESRKGSSGEIAPLCVDHCHDTGKIRALLCHDCNTGIGKFKDDVELLKLAINYLNHYANEKTPATEEAKSL